jgi:YbbR domain-containing protein
MKEHKIIEYRYPVRKYLVFLSFLALTIMFWLMNKLAQDYDTELKILPKVKTSLSGIYSTTVDNTLYVQVRASGFFILGKKFSENNSLIIDIKDSPEENHKKGLKIATVSLKDKIRDNFDKNVQILSIEPDTIYFNISEYVIKTVPVKGDFSLSLKKEFRQSSATQFFPDSVTIAGSREHVAGVKSITLSPKKYENIDRTVEGISNIAVSPNIYVDPSKIRYKIPVERCTEGSARVTLKTANEPTGSKLILLPSAVHIRYVVPLKDYNSVSINDFFAEVDFNDTQTSLNRHVKVKIVRCPSSVFDVRVEPSFVEFLIQK